MLKSQPSDCRAGWMLALLLIVAGCESTVPSEVHPLSDRVHQAIMSEHRNYTTATVQRALTGCFDWENSTPDEPDVRYLAVAARRGTGGGLSLDKLVDRALLRCEVRQRRDSSPCACQVIDRNGSNVLEPPPEFIQRFE